MRIPFITTLAGAALALGGCAYGDLGMGLGYGGGYGSSGYGYSPYYGASYGPYASIGYGSGYGYGSPYYGWYDGFYYPGTGYYVYDTYRRPRVWSDAQRVYWTQRVAAVPTTQRTTIQPNWNDFNRPRTTRTRATTARTQTVEPRRVARQERSERIDSRRTDREDRRAARRAPDEN